MRRQRTGDSPARRRHTLRTLLVALVASLAMLGCERDVVGGEVESVPHDGPDAGATAEPTSEATAAETTDTSAEGVPGQVALAELPADVDLAAMEGAPVLRSFAWLMDVLARRTPPAEAEIEAVFAESFLDEVGATELRQVLVQLAGDYRLTALEQGDATSLVGEIDAGGTQRFRLLLGVSADDPPEIEALLFQPPLAEAVDFEGWEEAEAALAELAPDVNFLAAEVDGDTCVPVAAAGADRRGPVASVFKLYVLGALADAVTAGTLAWDDTIVLQEQFFSLPTGLLQDEEPGTEVSVAEAASLMVALSDNTATDHLLDLLGRGAVEDAQAHYGHGDPDVNRPLLSTREAFQLKWQVDQDVRERFVDGDVETRRRILDDLSLQPLDLAPEDVDTPVATTTIEWFASPAELCDALVALDARAREPGLEPVQEALGANPVLRLDDVWVRSAAKGGSEPGVLALATLLERDDGRRFALTATLVGDGLDAQEPVPVLEGVLQLLAGVP